MQGAGGGEGGSSRVSRYWARSQIVQAIKAKVQTSPWKKGLRSQVCSSNNMGLQTMWSWLSVLIRRRVSTPDSVATPGQWTAAAGVLFSVSTSGETDSKLPGREEAQLTEGGTLKSAAEVWECDRILLPESLPFPPTLAMLALAGTMSMKSDQ